MKTLRYLVIIVFISISSFSHSQNLSDKKNLIQIQIHPLGRWNFGTASGNLEIDYERFLGKRNSWSFRIGIHPYFYNFNTTNSFYLVPISFQKIFWAESKNQFEVGFGTAPRFELYGGQTHFFIYFPMIHLMYRNNLTKRLHIRAGVTGYVTWGSTYSPSIGLGYKF